MPGVDVARRVARDLGEARDVRGDDRCARLQRLEDRQAEALVERGVAEDRAEPVQARELLVGDLTEEPNPVVRMLHDSIVLPAARPHDDEEGAVRQGFDQTQQVLARLERPGREHERAVESVARADLGGLTVECRERDNRCFLGGCRKPARKSSRVDASCEHVARASGPAGSSRARSAPRGAGRLLAPPGNQVRPFSAVGTA